MGAPAAVWGAYRSHGHGSAKNLTNAALCLVALWPAIVAAGWLFRHCDLSELGGATAGSPWQRAACDLALYRPVTAVNALYFLNVSVGFWLIGLLQRSFWLIDPYWTLLPPLIDLFFAQHPLARDWDLRSAGADALLWVWAARLTWNYFRREEWKFGQREDWRYTKMAAEHPHHWWWMSFFAVGIAQQPLLCLITAPLYTVHFRTAPLCVWDAVALALCVSGLTIAHFADNELWAYMRANEARVRAGQPRLPLLRTGLWRFSRHPNYFGEQLWWWGLAVLAMHMGDWWAVGGTAVNSVVFAVVTVMTEERMVQNWSEDRVRLYREYQRATSVWIPLPPREMKAA
eukprot:EG_transcript_13400